MNWFTRKRSQQKYVEAAITVATNLYLNTLPGADGAPTDLQFSLPDSRFRYLLFCLSAALTAALAYDEKKRIRPEALIQGCLQLARWAATENPRDYFDDSASSEFSIDKATTYLQEFLKHWSRWPELEKQGRNAEIIELISLIIHIAESSSPLADSDRERLGPLALQIDCWLPTMRGAFAELVIR